MLHGALMGRLLQAFSENLSKLRELKGLSQTELGTLTGLTRTTIGRYETADGAPSFEAIEKLAEALGVDPLDFFISEEAEHAIEALEQIRITTKQINKKRKLSRYRQMLEALNKERIKEPNLREIHYWSGVKDTKIIEHIHSEEEFEELKRRHPEAVDLEDIISFLETSDDFEYPFVEKSKKTR